MSIPFALKYQPVSLADIIGNDKAKELLARHVASPGKRALLLEGVTGSGKTAAVVAAAKQANLELVEMNASDERNQKGIEASAGTAAMQMSLFSKGKLILIDEIDGISGMKDRGAAKAVIELIEKTPFPVVLTANDVSDSKFSALRRKVQRVAWEPPAPEQVRALLASIAKKEGIEADDGVFLGLAHRCGGDVRAALCDLEVLAAGNKKITREDLESLGGRDHTREMHDVLFRILRTRDPAIAREALDTAGEDLDESLLWLEENIPYEYLLPKERAEAFGHLAHADVFRGRIRRMQHWRFLATMAPLMSAGVALSREGKAMAPVTYKKPGRILKMWIAKQRQASKMNLAKKLGPHVHASAPESFRTVIPLIRLLAKHDRRFAERLRERYKLEEEDFAWLK